VQLAIGRRRGADDPSEHVAELSGAGEATSPRDLLCLLLIAAGKQFLRSFHAHLPDIVVRRAVQASRETDVKGLARGTPEIFNTDQGVQYTATAFTDRLELAGVAISMDGRGRWMDNVFVERLWRTLKWEWVYLHDYATVRALEAGLAKFFRFYNDERIHAALDYLTPALVYAAA
jgi:transposase InsO family protein